MILGSLFRPRTRDQALCKMIRESRGAVLILLKPGKEGVRISLATKNIDRETMIALFKDAVSRLEAGGKDR